MKKFPLFLLLLTLITFFTSCNKDNDLTDSIPADAFYVVHVNSGSLAKKSEYDVFKNPVVMQGINLAKTMLDPSQKKLLDSFIANSNALGIDLKNESYYYMSDKELGLIFKVLDPKTIQNSFQTISKYDSVKVENGIYLLEGYNQSVIWDSNKLIFLTKLNDPFDSKKNKNIEELSVYAKRLLTQSSDKSINSEKSFRSFIAEKQDISLFYSIAKLQNYVQNSEENELSDILKNFEGVSNAYYLNFETGKIVTSGRYLYDSSETEKRFKTYMSQFTSTIKGEQLKFIPNNPLFITAISIKGDALNNYLKQTNSSSLFSSFGNPEVMQDIVGSVDGDITFAVSNIKNITDDKEELVASVDDEDSIDMYDYSSSSYYLKFDMTLLADVAKTDSLISLLNEAKENGSTQITELSTNIYKAKLDAYNDLYFGLKDKLFFTTTIDSIYNAIMKGKALDNAYKGNINNKFAYVSGNLRNIDPNILSFIDPYGDFRVTAAVKFLSLVNLFNEYNLSVDADSYEMKGEIKLNDEKNNSLKTICLAIDQKISEIATEILSNF